MVTPKGAQREDDRGTRAEEGSEGPLSSAWARGTERLPPPPQMPADGVSLIAPKWTRGRGNDVAGPAQSLSGKLERKPLGRIARYEVLGRVHLGRDVSVYLARSLRATIPGLVALKLSRHARTAPKNQPMPTQGSWSEALRAVAHPGLCELIEVTAHGTQSCVVHVWLEGVPLDRLLTRLTGLEKPMPPHIAASIVAQVAAGIDHAEHVLSSRGAPKSAGPTSIFPNDVMLCADGRAVLLDLRWRTSDSDATREIKGPSVRLLGDLLSTLLAGGGNGRNEPAPFSFRVGGGIPAELSEIVERTRRGHASPFPDPLALSTALQHFVGYESNQEEREAIAAFVASQFPDASAREPPIQTGPEVQRALAALHVAEQQAVASARERARSYRGTLWLAGGLLLVLAGYLLGSSL
jgi:hypothetical protein